MKVQVRNAGKAKVLEMRGHLALGDGDVLLRDTVRRLVEEGHANLVFNMKHITRLDSSGIGEMVACLLRVKRENGAIHLLLPPERVLSLLEMVGLRTKFRVFESEIDAVGSF